MILYLLLWLSSAIIFVGTAIYLFVLIREGNLLNKIKKFFRDNLFGDIVQFVIFFIVLYFIAYICITATFTIDWIPNVPDSQQCPANRQWFHISQWAKFGKYAGTICFGM